MKPWIIKTILLTGLAGMALVIMVHDYIENSQSANLDLHQPELLVSPTPSPTTYSIQGVYERDRERFGDEERDDD